MTVTLNKLSSHVFAPLAAILPAIMLLAAAPPSKPAAPAKVQQAAPAMPAMPDPSKDDPAKVAAAKEFITLYHPRTNPLNVSVQIERMMPVLIAQAKEQDPKLDVKKFAHERRQAAMQAAAKSLDRQAHVFSRHFTLPEINALIAWVRTPLAGKLVAETPKIQREMLMQNRQERMAEMAARAKSTKLDADEDDTAPVNAPAPAKAKPHK